MSDQGTINDTRIIYLLSIDQDNDSVEVQIIGEEAITVSRQTLLQASNNPDDTKYVYAWLLGWLNAPQRDARLPIFSSIGKIIQNGKSRDEAIKAGQKAERDAAERRRRIIQADQLKKTEMEAVEKRRKQTEDDDPWWPIPSWEVSDEIRFDTPGRNQGQMVEVSYGQHQSIRSEACSDAPYMCIEDKSERLVTFYKRRKIN